MKRQGWSSIEYWSLFIICNFLTQSSYYCYLIKVGLGGVRMLEVDASSNLSCYNCAKVRVDSEKHYYKKFVIFVKIYLSGYLVILSIIVWSFFSLFYTRWYK